MKYFDERIIGIKILMNIDCRRIKQSVLIILVLIISQSNNVYSQNNSICYQCKKNITGSYITIEGKTFHPDHFLCALCNKIIDGSFQSKEGKYYHPDCYLLKEGMICDYCKKILDQKYIVTNGKKYHKDCYEKFILPKCSICGLPLKDFIRVDNYGNKFHSYHKEELKQCDCCGRLICESLTGGGRDYFDGRHICNLCYATAVTNNWKVTDLLKKVVNKLNSLGIRFDEKKINITVVDRDVLKSKSKNYSDNTHGFCDSRTETESMNDRIIKKITVHSIYILSGMPLILTESTIAHELMHAWLNDNTKNNHTDKVREGSCNYISYMYLKSLNQTGVSDFITLLEKDPSPIYGKGFLEIRSRFEGKQFAEFIDYLKK
jgi:hypothetical protein